MAGWRDGATGAKVTSRSVPPEEIRAIARRSAFTSLGVRDAVLITPEEHEERLLLLLDGRAQETGVRRLGTDSTLLLVLNAIPYLSALMLTQNGVFIPRPKLSPGH